MIIVRINLGISSTGTGGAEPASRNSGPISFAAKVWRKDDYSINLTQLVQDELDRSGSIIVSDDRGAATDRDKSTRV